jgi:hypothetical protein
LIGNEFKKSGAEGDSVLDLLVSFSFHSGYIKTHLDNPLVLLGTSNTSIDQYIPIIRNAFRSQGYDDLKTMVIGKDDISLLEHYNTNKHFELQKGLDNFSSNYINAIKKITSSDFAFFFSLENPRELPRLLNIIEETDLIIRRDMFQVYSLLSENKSLNMKNNQLISELELLQEQIDSLGNYHLNYNTTIVRYKKQITELLKFYKNEYEILPLWYKRFGHIVKVLTGKRTFRSLFNDNVKKHGD